MTTENKFCRDCKWLSIPHKDSDDVSMMWRCMAPENVQSISLLTGKQEPAVYYCATARELEKWCGPDGRWYEPKSV